MTETPTHVRDASLIFIPRLMDGQTEQVLEVDTNWWMTDGVVRATAEDTAHQSGLRC